MNMPSEPLELYDQVDVMNHWPTKLGFAGQGSREPTQSLAMGLIVPPSPLWLGILLSGTVPCNSLASAMRVQDLSTTFCFSL